MPIKHFNKRRLLVLVQVVRLVDADHRKVCGDGDDVHAVGAVEFRRLGLRGTRHASELGVQAEVVLERDGRERLVLGLDRNALLRLERLVKAVGVAAPLEEASGVLVDDVHLAVQDHVLLVALEELLGLER